MHYKFKDYEEVVDEIKDVIDDLLKDVYKNWDILQNELDDHDLMILENEKEDQREAYKYILEMIKDAKEWI